MCFNHWFLSFFFIALDEARDINTHLKPLRRYIEEIEQTEIPELSLMLPSLMHLIGLIWGSSSYYCSPQKIVVLLQEIGNLLVAQVRIGPWLWFFLFSLFLFFNLIDFLYFIIFDGILDFNTSCSNSWFIFILEDDMYKL